MKVLLLFATLCLVMSCGDVNFKDPPKNRTSLQNFANPKIRSVNKRFVVKLMNGAKIVTDKPSVNIHLVGDTVCLYRTYSKHQGNIYSRITEEWNIDGGGLMQDTIIVYGDIATEYKLGVIVK